jgi:hypothetical protein
MDDEAGSVVQGSVPGNTKDTEGAMTLYVELLGDLRHIKSEFDPRLDCRRQI